MDGIESDCDISHFVSAKLIRCPKLALNTAAAVNLGPVLLAISSCCHMNLKSGRSKIPLKHTSLFGQMAESAIM
jgi:hypothetical protein